MIKIENVRVENFNLRQWFRKHQQDIVVFLHGSCLYDRDGVGWYDAAMWYAGKYKVFHGDLGTVPSPSYAMLVGAKECLDRVKRPEKVFVVTATQIMALNKKGAVRGKNKPQKEAVIKSSDGLDVTMLSVSGGAEDVARYIPSIKK